MELRARSSFYVTSFYSLVPKLSVAVRRGRRGHRATVCVDERGDGNRLSRDSPDEPGAWAHGSDFLGFL